MANKNSIENYEQKLYINGSEVLGVTDINGSYQINEDPIHIIGQGFTHQVRNGPMVGDFQLSKYYIGNDILLSYTGSESISGSIHYGDKSFGFENGYLTEYSLSCGVGQIPTATASIKAYGDIGSGINASGNEAIPEIQIANQGSIHINVNGFQSNRVSDFSYNIRANRVPVYGIGSPFPLDVHQQFPISQECSVTLEVFDYEVPSFKSFLSRPVSQDLIITLDNPISDSNIDKFILKDAKLSSQSLSSSAGNSMFVNLTYVAYINSPTRTIESDISSLHNF